MKKIIIACLLFLSVSCSKEDASQEIHETLYVRHEGADMPAYVHGNASQGKFLVVLHGAGSFGLSFRNLAFTERFEKEYVVVYFDQRGQSMSQGHYKKAEDVIAQMASDVKALTKVLQYNYGENIQLYLMGHSMGGLIGTKALLDPEMQAMYNGWINLDGVMDLSMAGAYRLEHIYGVAQDQISEGNSVDEWSAIQEKLKAMKAPDGADYDEVLHLTARGYSLLTKDEVVTQEVSKELFQNTTFKNNGMTWFFSNLMNKPINNAKELGINYVPELHTMDIPCLFIYGYYDLSVPPDAGYGGYLKWGHPDKEFLEYEHSMHHPFYSEPTRFEDDVTEFIDGH